jgi:hypothetical protein
MKKYLIVGLVFIIGLGVMQRYGASSITIGMVVISSFLVGLFIGQRRKRA